MILKYIIAVNNGVKDPTMIAKFIFKSTKIKLASIMRMKLQCFYFKPMKTDLVENLPLPSLNRELIEQIPSVTWLLPN